MAIDGTYGFVYCGVNGLGIGVFVVQAGHLRGRDYAGAEYDGTAKEAPDGSIDVDLRMKVPAGGTLVQGTSPQEIPHERFVNHRFPSGFGDGAPVEVLAQPGTVTLMIKRIPDGFARAATDGISVQFAKGLSSAG